MCSYNNPGVNRAVKRRPQLTEAQEIAARISENRRWLRSELAKRYPSQARIAAYEKRIAEFQASGGAL